MFRTIAGAVCDFVGYVVFEINRLENDIEDSKKRERHYNQEIKNYLEQDKQILINSEIIFQYINILPELKQKISKVTELKTRVKLLKEQLEKNSESIFSGHWDERYGEIIKNLRFDKLKEKIEKIYSRKANESSTVEQSYLSNILKIIKKWAAYILSFFRKQRSETGQVPYIEIRKMLRELPIEEGKIGQFGTKLVQSLRLLKDIYEDFCQLNESKESLEKENSEHVKKIKNIAKIVGIDIKDNIADTVRGLQDKVDDSQKHKKLANYAEQEIKKIKTGIKELISKKLSLAKELQEINQCLAKLGDGNIQRGIERFKQVSDVLNKAESLRTDLAKKYPDLNSLEKERNEAQQNHKDREYYKSEINHLDEEVKQIKKEMDKLKERLEQIPIPFPYVDKPIRRFLLYGGDIAKDFFSQSVRMINLTLKEKKVPSINEIGLPERVVKRFEEWWKKHEEIREESVEDKIIKFVLKSQNFFRNPVVLLDSAIGEIKVHFPIQRFSMSDEIEKICLIIKGDKSDSHKEYLRVYKHNNKLFETGEIDFPLPFPAEYYEFHLKNGSDIIKSWESITGISPGPPFMVFHYDSKRLIKGEELPKEKDST